MSGASLGNADPVGELKECVLNASNGKTMAGPPKLTLASETLYRLDRPPETTSERARRRQFEAQMLAREHIGELQRAIEAAEAVAATVIEGGAVYPASVREAVGRIQARLEMQGRTLDALMERIPEPQL